jgi:hypothetical protein
MFLVNAIEHPGDAGAWALWGAVLAFSLTVIVVAMRRASRLAREFRQREWGEKRKGTD